jgi:maltooligosyltrehalose trehalohydrolase
MSAHFNQALPFGAELQSDGSTRFRLWAPSVSSVMVELDDAERAPMRPVGDGWYEAQLPVGAGARYRFSLPDGLSVPDPASRLQAGDVHDPSVVIDPREYSWRQSEWRGRPWHETVIYELHPGLLGGFHGVAARLPMLAALGITAVELMPIADFPGRRNWGYDGVLPFAPDTAYGTPNNLKSLIDTAHELGLMVFLDVVYNHFGPDGAYLHVFAKPFFREDITTPWGAAIDFRRIQVRDYFIKNAIYWLNEYRFDGLRFDAVHAISEPDFLDEMAVAIHEGVDEGRHVHLVLEHGDNEVRHLRKGPGKAGYNAIWNDDWHHCVHVLLTGEQEGYYTDYRDATHLLARCLAEGLSYQGQYSQNRGGPRGTPSGHLPPSAFVIGLQNHDQVGNRAFGERPSRLFDPQGLRAATAMLLLSPFVPLLFMGEEWGTRRPFLFFTSHNDELAELVRQGRREEFKKFLPFKDPEQRKRIPDPNAKSTFDASVPDEADGTVREFYSALLTLRARHIVPGIPGCHSSGADVIGDGAVLARWRMGVGSELVMAVNFGNAPVALSKTRKKVLFVTGVNPGDGILAAKGFIAWYGEDE